MERGAVLYTVSFGQCNEWKHKRGRSKVVSRW